eukprot:gene20959-27163_t
MKSLKQQPLGIPNLQSTSIPSPFQSIVDVNLDRNNIVYEVELSRDHGLEIIQGNGYAIVGNVPKGSKVEQLGILSGDIVVATSATAGNQLWTHDSVDSIKSALSTRFVLYPTVKIRLERSLNLIPVELKHLILVPYITTVIVKRPLGLHVAEGEKSKVFIQHMKEDCGAAKTKRLEIGDQVVAMSASWGDQMWTITSVESFIMSVRMHTSPILSLRVKRLVPLDIYLGQIVTARMQRQLVRQQKSQHKKIDKEINNKIEKSDANAVLKLYELSKTLGLTCTVVTYGVIIKALLRSKNPKLQVKSFEILKSLPNLGITPGVEIFNQFLEFYSSTCNYKMAKKVLVLMSRTKPKVKPDVVSYGYLINCFAVSKKPKSALMIYYQMRQRHIQPNGFTYMGILKALSYLRDGRSAFLILREMEKCSEIESTIDNNSDDKINGNFLFSQEDDPLLDLIDPIDSAIVVGTKLLDSSIEDNSLDEIDKKIYYAGEDGNLRTPTYDGLLFTIETLRKLSLLDKFTVQV